MRLRHKTAIFAAALALGAGIFAVPRLQKRHEKLSQLSFYVPLSPEQVHSLGQSTIDLFNQDIQKLFSLEPSSYTFENTILHWDQMGLMLIERLATLKSLPITGAGKKTLQAADAAYTKVVDHVQKTLTSSPSIITTLIYYLERSLCDERLTQSQWYYLDQVARTIDPAWFPPPLADKVKQIQSAVSAKQKVNFTFLQSGATGKKLKGAYSPFTLLNLNVCFLPGSLPLLYGGVLPWPMRIEKVTARILSLDADIVCLQEVFERKASLALFEGLKEKYRFFYMDIGPQNFGLRQDAAGLSSGLFVASKIPLEAAQFIPFREKNPNVNRGFFSFELHTDTACIAKIYTTHLEAFNDDVSIQNRYAQLSTLIDVMEERRKQSSHPPLQILLGDLNIPMGSQEPAEKIYCENFLDTSWGKTTAPTDSCRTYIDFTDFWWKAKTEMAKYHSTPEVLDYAALYRGKEAPSFQSDEGMMVSAIAPMNEREKPKEALSDHHGLISYVQVNKKNH